MTTQQTKWDDLVEKVCRQISKDEGRDPDHKYESDGEEYYVWEENITTATTVLSAFFAMFGPLTTSQAEREFWDNFFAYREMKEEPK